ncbi:MAG: hypothetical protein R3F02_00595 [Thiolinea sp.]
MAIWDTVKKIALSAKCATGWHTGAWNHIKGQPECRLEKICLDCKKYVTTTKHKYGDWRYVDYSSCNSVQECIYCGSINQEVIHKYTKVGKDENCRIIEKCNRCENQKLGRSDHNWIKLFDHEIKNKGKRKCKDCGQTEL